MLFTKDAMLGKMAEKMGSKTGSKTGSKRGSKRITGVGEYQMDGMKTGGTGYSTMYAGNSNNKIPGSKKKI